MGFDSVANLFVRHDTSNGEVHYYSTNVWTDSGQQTFLSFVNPHGFSDFTISEDNRTAVVKFTAGNTVEKTFTPLNVGDSLPTATQSGSTFQGWQFEGVEGTWTVLTDELLTALSGLYTANGGTAITATAVFTAKSASTTSTSSSSSSSETEATTEAAAVASADTGDTSHAERYLLLLAASALCLIGIAGARRRKQL